MRHHLAPVIWLAMALQLAAGTAGCFRYWRLESTRQRLGIADVIVVPGFELTQDGLADPLLYNRIAMARVLLAGGYGQRVLLSGGKPKQGVTEAQKMVELARRLGISDTQLMVESRAFTSYENAEFSADLLQEQGLRSALVVSDAAHLSYCVPLFRDAFHKRGLELYWTPVDYALLSRLGIGRAPRSAPL